MDSDHRVTFQWHGAAHYHLTYQNLKTVIDPLYSRLPGDKPHLDVTRDSIDRIDHLLLTHGHLDHSWDVPYLVAKHDPGVYAPQECLRDVQREMKPSEAAFSVHKYHSLEEIKGKTFGIGDIDVTPYQIGTEEIDFWFIRSMFIRPLVHATPGALPTGFRWLTHHVFGNCFAFHFQFPHPRSTMLYFGNLTNQVDEMAGIESVDILAIPYCPANKKWLRDSQYLIERFQPGVTMVHHFDNFMNPFTLPKYMNLDDYRRALQGRCPDARFYFSKFLREVDLAEIVGG
jgi:L-ascorbate metabolism protein UlaG (beta-lactamase superfamily)